MMLKMSIIIIILKSACIFLLSHVVIVHWKYKVNNLFIFSV